MSSHYKGIALALLLLTAAFVLALALGQQVVAYGLLILGVGLIFVMSIAYMRPHGRTPEHHAKVDRVVKDTKP
jgi:hypothetical protein